MREKIDIFTKVLKECDVVEAKLQTLDFVLGLTGSKEGLDMLYKKANEIFAALIDLTYHFDQDVAQRASIILVNISAELYGAHLLSSVTLSALPTRLRNNVCNVNNRDKIFSVLFDHLFEETSLGTPYAIMILVNLSRNKDVARIIYDCLENGKKVIKSIAKRAIKTDQKYDYLPSLLANLNQLQEVRKIFLEPNQEIFRKLLTLIDCKIVVRRSGVVGIIRNLCFSVENHERLLNPGLGLLSRLLLPLAGPEELDDRDNEKLPVDLQYLPTDKMRESEVSIRKQLLEIILQLCATKFGRELMRKYNVYVILRELHKWEMNEECLTTCENLVNIIIRTEEEIGVDNLKDIDIPPSLMDKFSELE